MFKMLFCPKCGSVLKPGKQKGTLECPRCKLKLKPKEGTIVSEKLKRDNQKVEVMDEEEEVLSKTKEECPKCGNKEAYYWLQQTRAGDEPETKFLKCTKCKHVWRDYG